MLLSPEDASRFFKLMPALQVFANRKLHFTNDLDDVEQYQEISNEKRIALRNALYKKPELIDEFVRENPFNFSSDELAVVYGWNNFVAGDFMIDRLLKKYAIFIGNNKVYGVLALTQPFHQVLGGTPLPVYIKTVLLPFKGKIIYDGLIEGYNIFFGRGVATSTSNTYRAAKLQGKIIESLEPGWQPPEPKVIVSKNWKPVLDELSEKASKLRAGGGDSPVLSPAFSMIRASLELTPKSD
ncbi:MAG TPA: hypothetical protein VJ785_18220 [Anaerolineales bacterium]|nr:hypothetical protein [Anaerolineales bacterium]